MPDGATPTGDGGEPRRPDSALPVAQLPGWADELVARAANCGEDVPDALRIAVDAGAALPLPGRGDTALRWAVLAALARVNLTVARIVESHADAVAILDEAGLSAAGSWGVFAAEQAGRRLTGSRSSDAGFLLDGVKPWCSLGGDVDAALVTADTDGGRRLFRVDLRQAGVRADPPQTWVARGLRTVTSVPLAFDRVRAEPVGAAGWYLTRPGFAWGGMGVAACWYGGALGLADTLSRKVRAAGGDLPALHAGTVDVALFASAAVLADAAARVDTGDAAAGRGELLALRVRAVVAAAAERVLREVGHALGPAPLAFDAEHAARVADLGLYVRQHHGERDLAALGTAVLGDARCVGADAR